MSYSELDQDRRQIRLLDLHPGVLGDNIRCQLQTVSSDDKPQYNALSYCWGDERHTLEIRLNGQTVPVTANLATALKNMRRPDDHVIVWNDATCIDQSNEDEKKIQIGMMGQIYAEGKGAFQMSCHCW